jgi:hypothetical protein
MTLQTYGLGIAFDRLWLSKLEEIWFGNPVYVIDNNNIWLKNDSTIINAIVTFSN